MIHLPYGKNGLSVAIPEANLQGVYESAINEVEAPSDAVAVVRQALEHPIGSPRLCELASGKRKVVIIASDHTRPVPSKVIMPLMLEEIRRGNPEADITLLIATGTHRETTREELVGKFGEDIVSQERIVVHDCYDETQQAFLGILPSGGELWINRLAVEADLLVSEGFIEPHFFAGFSGGRKSVLPGIASKQSVLANHCAMFIASERSRTGKLEGNPIHEDMVWAARRAKLAFICNVVINSRKQVMTAVAGDCLAAHQRGVDDLRKLCQLTIPLADIAVTTNGGYPLDQNLYQSVKGMTAGEAAVKPGGVIIMVTACNDGHGGQSFYDALAQASSPKALYDEISAVPQSQTVPEQWEAQIFARILSRNKLILVSDECPDEILDGMHLCHVHTFDEALQMALSLQGQQARIAVIPDGVSVIVN